jgi:hypothetical protein
MAPNESGLGHGARAVLSRAHEFKLPEEWIGAGRGLQAPGGGDGRVLQARIGLDFGTAYTKVAVRLADTVHFVQWSGVRSSEAIYFLPGECSRMGNDSAFLGRSAAASEVHSALKVPFLAEAPAGDAQKIAAMIFLASVLRYTRAWVYRTLPSFVGGRRLVWQLNLGCPTNSWSATTVRRSYQQVALLAWQLSQTDGEISWPAAASLLQQPLPSAENVGLDGLNAIPEFVAQIAGYVRSPQRRDGLHLLMDVGAGTVDLATFNVAHDDVREEDRYPIFASDVTALGTHFLTASRLQSAGLGEGGWDEFQVIPSATDFAREFGVEPHSIDAADQEFAKRLFGTIGRVVTYTRTQRYGKAPEWKKGVPVFVSGGGADCPIYSNALHSVFNRSRVPIIRTAFPALEETVAATSPTANDFHRLAVAYGLTFDAESIGRIFAPHEIADAPAFDPAVDVRRERPDRDDLYPK